MEQHKRNALVTVFWPNAPHDFVMMFESIEPSLNEGWYWLKGHVVEPSDRLHDRTHTFYVREVKGGYELLPAHPPVHCRPQI